MRSLRLGLLGVCVVTLLGCGSPMALQGPVQKGAFQARSAGAADSQLAASVLMPEQVPSALRQATHTAVQKASDDASRKKGLDFFHVHSNPVGLKIAAGGASAYVLSFLGTSKETPDINYEARALVADGKVGIISNYSGPGTLSTPVDRLLPRPLVENQGFDFELLMGLPGNGVTEAYERTMERLGLQLQRRFQARPFQFDEDCIVLALHQGSELAGFLFTHQRNRLVLGERKYADVQSVVLMSPEAEVLAAYTLVGFNRKTPTATTAPTYTWERFGELGSVGIFGEY